MDDDDKAAIGEFFSAFEKLETVSLDMALRSLSTDARSVDEAGAILDFDARLKLLERMAFARSVPAGLMSELEELLLRARQLHALRDDVARSLGAEGEPDLTPQTHHPPGPRKSSRKQTAHLARLVELANSARSASRVRDYTREAVQLREMLHIISQKLVLHVTGSDTAL